MQSDAIRAETMTLTHWGAYRISTAQNRVVDVRPLPDDPEPSAIGQSLLDMQSGPVRILEPMVRAGYLEGGHGSSGAKRGAEPFVAVDWPTAIDLAAEALGSVRERHGNAAIYGGSYGWASAGRFHHAQSQLHRFLNVIGGYTSSRDTYSMGAMEVVLPHVLCPFPELFARAPAWADVARHTELVVSFGGLALKNSQVNVGGTARHRSLMGMRECAEAGVRFVNVSPIASDVASEVAPEWIPVRPNSDTALMLALAYVMIEEDLVDREFIDRCCVGYERFEAYVLGRTDGMPKTPRWASALCGVPDATIERLGREIPRKRTLITVSWSVQRADHGEQPIWMGVVLAAMGGSMGLPGGGISVGQNAIQSLGAAGAFLPAGSLPQGENPVPDFIPVARIADMLLNPGAGCEYDGRTIRYPDIQLVYWAGGNAFHHHQDLGKLTRAWRKPGTIIVHEPFWTAAARFSDIVFPSATMLERNDIGAGSDDGTIIAMKKAVDPPAGVLTDYETFAAIAARLGSETAFTEGLDERQWLERIYATTRERCAGRGLTLPDFDAFWSQGLIDLPPDPPRPPICAELRADPAAHPLRTPSGKIEIFSATIAGFEYEDCPGHPAWMEPYEWLGAVETPGIDLHLVSNQPSTRLHSQLDFGRTSVAHKAEGRELCRLHPEDARARGIADGDTVRIYNERGRCLSVAALSDQVRRGVIQLATGAWYDPEVDGDPESTCLRGNPNVVTCDRGTSRLAQATTAHTCLVGVERVETSEAPPARPYGPPVVVARANEMRCE